MMARSGLDVDFLLFENRFGCAVTVYDTMVHYPIPHISRPSSIKLDFTLKLHTLSTANEHCINVTRAIPCCSAHNLGLVITSPQ